jgi:hypothetical protein
MCILSITYHQFPCNHRIILSEADRKTNSWSIRARLAGYERPDTTLCGVVAYSTGSTRIADASWAHIYVWALEPSQLTGDSLSYGYYHGARGKQSVILFPAVVFAGSVVHQMAFSAKDENELWALTSRGLVRFNTGPSCSRKTEPHLLETGPMDTQVDGAAGYWL